MFNYSLTVLLDVFMKDAFQLRMNGTLAAIRQNNSVERLVDLIENDLVVTDERIFPDPVWPEIRFNVVPVQP